MTHHRVVIVGAGGHAREVLQILLACHRGGTDIEPIGFLDDGHPTQLDLDGFPVLGGLEWFERPGHHDVKAVCAVGTPFSCKPLVQRVQALGVAFAPAISPLAWIAESARVGVGCMVFPNVVVNTGAVVGDHVTLNVAATVSHDAWVGSFCSVGPGAHLAGNVSLGEGTFVGMGANVVQGVSIGPWTVIGAGAVVLDDLPADVTAVGVPARVVGPATRMPMGPRTPSGRS